MRAITESQKAALAAYPVRPAFLLKIEYPGDIVRAWLGTGNIIHKGETWLGAGLVMGVRQIESSSELKVSTVDISLSSIPQDMIARINLDIRNRKARLYYGLLDETRRLIGDPIPLQEINMEHHSVAIQDNGTATLTIHGSVGLVDLQRATAVAWTAEEQKRRYPDLPDSGLDAMPTLVEKDIPWRPRDFPIDLWKDVKQEGDKTPQDQLDEQMDLWAAYDKAGRDILDFNADGHGPGDAPTPAPSKDPRLTDQKNLARQRQQQDWMRRKARPVRPST